MSETLEQNHKRNYGECLEREGKHLQQLQNASEAFCSIAEAINYHWTDGDDLDLDQLVLCLVGLVETRKVVQDQLEATVAQQAATIGELRAAMERIRKDCFDDSQWAQIIDPVLAKLPKEKTT